MQYQETTLLLCDFIQVWIHQILYQRELYPKGSFEQRKHYDVPVVMSSNPGVCTYVKEFVTSLQPLLEKQQCQLVSLVVLSNTTQQALERYVFQMDYYANVKSTTMADEDIQHYFRACLLKLNVLPSLLSSASLDCTYALGVELVSSGADDFDIGLSNVHTLLDDKHTTWVPGDSTQSSAATTWAQLVPIKTMTMSGLKINTYVMESRRKGKQVAYDST
ncbi:DNA-binding protein [Absidia repens]|uniref:DNA-binding protein n=1 Tax=Absidia repens TaxID=90262 RepID=A0A1X2I7E9_9FUNG|nr:DNA-binding protein [Absidia repens]